LRIFLGREGTGSFFDRLKKSLFPEAALVLFQKAGDCYDQGMKALKHFRSTSFLIKSFAVHMQFYRAHHRTKGCRATHMIGVPMIVASFFVFPYNKKASLQLQAGGWFLQFVGHFVFEHNKPVFLEMRDPMTLVAAVVFVSNEWVRVLKKGP